MLFCTIGLLAVVAKQGLAEHPMRTHPIELLLPPSQAEPIKESGRVVECPTNFRLTGDECTQEVKEAPDWRCPPQFTLMPGDRRCVQYISKLLRCPLGYERDGGGVCIRIHQVEAESYCPGDFAFDPDATYCVRTTRLGHILTCPKDSVRRADTCFKRVVYPVRLSCPPGHVLSGDSCYAQSDCAPSPTTDLHVDSYHEPKPTRDGPPPVDRSAACNGAVASVKPRLVCPQGAIRVGHECVGEERRPGLKKPGGYKEEYAPFLRRCPKGYREGPFGRCYMRLQLLPEPFCPKASEDIAEKCAVYTAAVATCSGNGFQLATDGMCVKTVAVPPTIKYSVTYACTSKDCVI